MKEAFETNIEPKRLLLVSVETPDMSDCVESLAELKELCENLNAVVVGTISQKRNTLHPATCIGEGKVDEIKELAAELHADMVVFDLELTPTQHKNIETAIEVDVRDRTMIILDIFADRANTSEGKIQVELARLQYLLPRLKGSYQSLSRIGGAGNVRGAGESKLEMDKRYIRERIQALRDQILEVKKRRDSLRNKRKKDGIVTVAICGYTNAGKSTLLNALTKAEVLVANKLFATLDPTSRSLTLPDGRNVMLIDTVGFIRRLPHNLIEAFRSTLEEVLYADVLVVLCDASSPELNVHLEVSLGILQDLQYTGEVLTVLNKCDLLPPTITYPNAICISAKKQEGFDNLLLSIQHKLPEKISSVQMVIPYSESNLLYKIKQTYKITEENYTDHGTAITALLDAKAILDYKLYILNDEKFLQ